ncbi:hypothetical protein L1049_002555 [Liquidambar formosana]|uniref:Uncharacterized protein n=1 Tax=Liquidambar formosana TaxID=63359 RepID=A0AAP0NJY5_LIQFO
MDHECGRGSVKHLRTDFEAIYDEAEPPLSQGKRSASSSSSDSSSPELDVGEKNVLSSSLLKSEQNDLGPQGPISSPKVSPNTSVVSMSGSAMQSPNTSVVSMSGSAMQSPNTSVVSMSGSAMQSPNTSVASMSGSAMQSPTVQMMGRTGGYDPNRIPACVFSSKPATPMEWSVASNESLFSIHIGNTSFSRDHFILLTKSQELTKPEDMSNLPTNLPSVTEAMETERSANLRKESKVTEVSAETTKVVLSETIEDHSKEKLPPAEGVHYSVCTSYPSDGRGNSINSFAFPVLVGEEGRNSSVKEDPQKQQSQPLCPGATPNATGTNWFLCFCCCPLRC